MDYVHASVSRLGLALLVTLMFWVQGVQAQYAASSYSVPAAVNTSSSASGSAALYGPPKCAGRGAACNWEIRLGGGGYAVVQIWADAAKTQSLGYDTLFQLCGSSQSWTNVMYASLNTGCSVAPVLDCTSSAVKSKYLGAGAMGTGVSLPGTICIQGCAYNAGSTGVQVGTSYSSDIGMGTGSTCSGANYDTIDTTTKPTDPPSLRSCAQKGQVYGTVNGVGICAGAGTVPNSTVTQNSSTTTQATSASGVQAPAQTTGDSTTVSNVGGVPTVTDTKTNPDGSKTTTTQDKPSYCAMNPTAQVCRESSSNVSGGGDCAAAPVCQGDAVQCAMVNQQWHTRCDSNQQSSMSDLGNQILGGNDPAQNPATHRTSSNISSSIDQSTFLTGGGLADKVVTVHGNAITLPFSRLNQYLSWLGHIFVVMSLIGAIRIVIGGFK